MNYELLYIVWNPSLEAFSIGPWSIRWYSLCWLIGLALAFFIVRKLYKEQKIKDELFDPLFFYCFIGILVGARLGHCIFYQPDYFLTSGQHFVEMFLPIHFGNDVVAVVAVVCDADKLAKGKIIYACLFLNFPQGGCADVFPGLLMAFRKVPEAVAAYKQEVSAPVGNQASGGVHLTELRAQSAVDFFFLASVSRDIDAGQGCRCLEHAHERVYVYLFPNVELHGIGVCQ